MVQRTVLQTVSCMHEHIERFRRNLRCTKAYIRFWTWIFTSEHTAAFYKLVTVVRTLNSHWPLLYGASRLTKFIINTFVDAFNPYEKSRIPFPYSRMDWKSPTHWFAQRIMQPLGNEVAQESPIKIPLVRALFREKLLFFPSTWKSGQTILVCNGWSVSQME